MKIISDNMRSLFPPACPSSVIDKTLKYFKDYAENVKDEFGYSRMVGSYPRPFDRPVFLARFQYIENGLELTVSNGRIGSWLDGYFRPDRILDNLSKIFRFKAWAETSSTICETLSVKGSNEIVKECYEAPFEARLLLNECQYIYRPSFPEAMLYLAGAPATFLAVRNLYAKNYKEGLIWTGIAAVAFILPLAIAEDLSV